MHKKKLAGIVLVVAAVAVLNVAGTADAASKKVTVNQIAALRGTPGPGGPRFRPAPPPRPGGPGGPGFRPAPPPRPGGPGGPGFRPAPPPRPGGPGGPGFHPAPPPPSYGHRPPPPPPRYHRHRDRDDLFVVGGAMLLLGAILGGAN